MGSGSTKRVQEEDNSPPMMDNIYREEKCLIIFNDDFSSMKWTNNEVKNLSENLSKLCVGFKKKRINIKKRKEIAAISLKTDITEKLTKCLQYTYNNLKEVLEKDESYLKNSIETETGDNLGLGRSLSAQHIVCSIAAFFVNNTDASAEFCSECVKSGTMDVLLRIVTSYQTICNEPDKKVCLYTSFTLSTWVGVQCVAS